MGHTVPGLLAIRAGEDADAVALTVDGERPLTYGRWLARARAGARGLAARGVSRGDRIGLVFDCADWDGYAVAFCAVHLAGAAAVPLSAHQPEDRLREVLAEARAREVVHGPAELAKLEADGAGPGALAEPEPGDLAQILYTSGTTGRPKGVGAGHANLTAGFVADPAQRPLAHSRHALHAFPVGTNAGQTMLLNALIARPAILTMSRFDSERLCALVAHHRVGSVFLVPAMAVDLLQSGAPARHDLTGVRLVGSTAAALPPTVAMRLADAFPSATIVNYYTSTEAAPAQTTMIFDRRRPAAVGRPARPGDIMIRGADGAALGAGQTGAVWLRSGPASRCYVDDPAATSEVFDGGWVRMGDIGFVDGDGYLHLVDRESDIIVTGAHKVSSLRVENALHAHPDVIDAAVLGVAHPSMGAMIGAVIVAKSTLDSAELRAFLGTSLASHEIPAHIAFVEALPRNEAGKVVKRELPRPVQAEPLRTPAERRLARIWRETLGAAEISATSDFFRLGGDSMRAAQVAALAAERWGVDVSAEDVLARPAVKAFAAWIDERPAMTTPIVVSGRETQLTALQRLWLAERNDTGEMRVVPVYVAIRVDEPLDPDLVRRCLETLAERHDELGKVSCEHRTAADMAHATAMAAEFVTAAAHPPVRALVITVAPQQHLLVLSIDHMVCDGWSMGILLRELGLLYSARAANRLRPLEVTAADVARWVQDQWARTRPYWESMLHSPIADPPPLPGQLTRPEVYDGASHEFTVAADVVHALRAAAHAHHTTPARVTLAAWAAALHRQTGAAELAFMTPLTGRTRPEWERVVGCLIQQPIVRIRLDDDPAPHELLARVHREVAEATEHQFYPVHEFAGRVAHPAYFFFEPWARPAHVPGLASTQVPLPPELGLRWPLGGRADLSPPRLRLTDRGGVLEAQMVFNGAAVPRATIEDLADSFLNGCDLWCR